MAAKFFVAMQLQYLVQQHISHKNNCQKRKAFSKENYLFKVIRGETTESLFTLFLSNNQKVYVNESVL